MKVIHFESGDIITTSAQPKDYFTFSGVSDGRAGTIKMIFNGENRTSQDNEIVSYERKVRYRNADHAKMTGSGYTVTFSFTGIKPGETKMLIEERSPIADNLDRKYNVVVDEELHVSIEELSVVDIYDQPEELQE